MKRAAPHLEIERGHGLEDGGKHAQQVDDGQGDTVALGVQQPGDDGDADEAEGRHHIGDVGHHMRAVALVLQLQARRSQVELHGSTCTFMPAHIT